MKQVILTRAQKYLIENHLADADERGIFIGCYWKVINGNMKGIRGNSYKPRWSRSSWDGLQYNQFSIFLREDLAESLKKKVVELTGI